jgi:hypothetical protein
LKPGGRFVVHDDVIIGERTDDQPVEHQVILEPKSAASPRNAKATPNNKATPKNNRIA